MADPKVIAAAFDKVLREWLSPADYSEVVRRNATPQYRDCDICASHDFCDSNEAMMEAFENAGVADDAALWNAAWNAWRESTLPQPTTPAPIPPETASRRYLVRDESGRGCTVKYTRKEFSGWDLTYTNDPDDEYATTLGEWLDGDNTTIGDEFFHDDDNLTIIRIA